MAANTEEKKNVTGLDLAPDRREAEYDLVTALLEAAAYKTSDDELKEVTIARRGKKLFTVTIHPLSDAEVKQAQKQAGIYKPNPNNKKLGLVKVGQETDKLASWLIYLATIESDQEKIWGNKQIMSQFNLMQPWETVDVLLKKGEKDDLLEHVFDISGMNDDDDEGEQQDQETFQ